MKSLDQDRGAPEWERVIIIWQGRNEGLLLVPHRMKRGVEFGLGLAKFLPSTNVSLLGGVEFGCAAALGFPGQEEFVLESAEVDLFGCHGSGAPEVEKWRGSG